LGSRLFPQQEQFSVSPEMGSTTEPIDQRFQSLAQQQRQISDDDFIDRTFQELEQPEPPKPISQDTQSTDTSIETPKSPEVESNDDLVSAIAFGESANDPNAISPTGASGIQQFIKSTARNLGLYIEEGFTSDDARRLIREGRTDPSKIAELRRRDERFDPVKSRGAAKRLERQITSQVGDDIDKKLAAYNIGPAVVKAAEKLARQKGTDWRDELDNPVTDKVVKKILKAKGLKQDSFQKEKIAKIKEVKDHRDRIKRKLAKIKGSNPESKLQEVIQEDQKEQLSPSLSDKDIGSITGETFVDRPIDLDARQISTSMPTEEQIASGDVVAPFEQEFPEEVDRDLDEFGDDFIDREFNKLLAETPTSTIDISEEEAASIIPERQVTTSGDVEGTIRPTTLEDQRLPEEIRKRGVAEGLRESAGLDKQRARVIGGYIPPHSGTKQTNMDQFIKDVQKEWNSGKDIVEKLGVSTEDFEFAQVFPTQASLESYVTDEFVEENYPGEDPVEKRNDLRSYLAWNKRSGLMESAKEKLEKANRLYPIEERKDDLFSEFDKLEQGKPVTTAGEVIFSSSITSGIDKVLREIPIIGDARKGWDRGAFNSEMSQMLARVAFFDPESAAELVPTLNQIDALIEEGKNKEAKNAATLFIGELSETLQPMLKTGAVAAASTFAGAPHIGSAYMYGTWTPMAAGIMFKQLVNDGVDPNQAMSIAAPMAIPHTIIERVQQMSAIRGNVFSNAITKALSKSVKSRLTRGGIDLVSQTMPEILEEAAQGAVEETARITGKQLGKKEKQEASEILKGLGERFVQSGVESVPQMLAIGLLGMATRGLVKKLSKNKVPEDAIIQLMKIRGMNIPMSDKVIAVNMLMDDSNLSGSAMELLGTGQFDKSISEVDIESLNKEIESKRISRDQRRTTVEEGMDEEIREIGNVVDNIFTDNKTLGKKTFREYWQNETGQSISSEESGKMIQRYRDFASEVGLDESPAYKEFVEKEEVVTEEKPKERKLTKKEKSLQNKIKKRIESQTDVTPVVEEAISEEVSEVDQDILPESLYQSVQNQLKPVDESSRTEFENNIIDIIWSRVQGNTTLDEFSKRLAEQEPSSFEEWNRFANEFKPSEEVTPDGTPIIDDVLTTEGEQVDTTPPSVDDISIENVEDETLLDDVVAKEEELSGKEKNSLKKKRKRFSKSISNLRRLEKRLEKDLSENERIEVSRKADDTRSRYEKHKRELISLTQETPEVDQALDLAEEPIVAPEIEAPEIQTETVETAEEVIEEPQEDFIPDNVELFQSALNASKPFMNENEFLDRLREANPTSEEEWSEFERSLTEPVSTEDRSFVDMDLFDRMIPRKEAFENRINKEKISEEEEAVLKDVLKEAKQELSKEKPSKKKEITSKKEKKVEKEKPKQKKEAVIEDKALIDQAKKKEKLSKPREKAKIESKRKDLNKDIKSLRRLERKAKNETDPDKKQKSLDLIEEIKPRYEKNKKDLISLVDAPVVAKKTTAQKDQVRAERIEKEKADIREIDEQMKSQKGAKLEKLKKKKASKQKTVDTLSKSLPSKPKKPESIPVTEGTPDIPQEVFDYIEELSNSKDVDSVEKPVKQPNVKKTKPENAKEPTEAQKEAGNYAKDHSSYQGMEFSIENRKGETRSGKDDKGREWSVKMNDDYGYIKGTIGADKENIDIFVAEESQNDEFVFVINQDRPNSNEFDEHKVMIGYQNQEEAVKAYLSNFEKGWEENIHSVVSMPIETFKTWAYDKKQDKSKPLEQTYYLLEGDSVEDSQFSKGDPVINTSQLENIIPKEVLEKIEISESKVYFKNGVAKKLASDQRAVIRIGPDKVQIVLRPNMSEELKAYVMTHEVISHLGVSRVLDSHPEIKKEMEALYKSDTELRPKIEEIYSKEAAELLEEGKDPSDFLLMEWIAHSNDQFLVDRNSLWKKVVNLFKKLLRKMGLRSDDMDSLLEKVFQEMKNNPEVLSGKKQEPEFQFSKETPTPTSESVNPDISKLKKEVDKAAEKYKKFYDEVRSEKSNIIDVVRTATQYARLKFDDDLKVKIRDIIINEIKPDRLKTKKAVENAKNRIKVEVDRASGIMFRREIKKQFLDTIKDLFEASRDGKIPNKYKPKAAEILDRLSKTSFAVLTDTELLQNLQEAQVLIKIIQEEFAEFEREKKNYVDGIIAQGTENMSVNRRRDDSVPAEAAEAVGGAPSTNKFIKTLKNTPKRVLLSHLSQETIAEMLDQYDIDNEKSAITEAYFGNLDKGFTVVTKITQEVGESFREEFKSNFKKESERSPLEKTKDFILGNAFTDEFKSLSSLLERNRKKWKLTEYTLENGTKIELTPGQKISFYLHGMNNHNKKAISNEEIYFSDNPDAPGVKLGESDIEILTSPDNLTALEKKLADFIYQTLNGYLKPILEKTSKEAQGYEINVVEHYFPLRRTNINEPDAMTKAIDKGGLGIYGEGMMLKYMSDNGALQERNKYAKGDVVIEDALTAMMNNAKTIAGFAGFEVPFRVIKSVNPELKKAAIKYGKKAEMAALNKTIENLQNPYVPTTYLEKTTKRLLNASVVAILSANLKVALKQLGSIPVLATELEWRYLAPAMKTVLEVKNNDHIEYLMNIIENYSPQIKGRLNESIVNVELSGGHSTIGFERLLGDTKNLKDRLIAMIPYMDTRAILTAVDAADRKVKKENPSLTGEKRFREVARLSEKAIRRTQPMFTNLHRSALGRNPNVFVRGFVTFTSATNALFQTVARSVMRYVRGDDDFGRFAINILSSVVMSSLFIAIVNESWKSWVKGKDRDWKQLGKDFAGDFGNNLLAPIYFSSQVAGLVKDIADVDPTAPEFRKSLSNFMPMVISDVPFGIKKVTKSLSEGDLTSGASKADLAMGTFQLLNGLSALTGGFPLINHLSGIPFSNIARMGEAVAKKFDVEQKGVYFNKINEIGYKPRLDDNIGSITVRDIKYGIKVKSAYLDAYHYMVVAKANQLFQGYIYSRLKTEEKKKQYLQKIMNRAKKSAAEKLPVNAKVRFKK
jgi:hypothetical protein